ncbi:DNA-directed RNA polymerase subunit D [Halorhabdus sp. CBA1104]|uniref:DNA-directed RNA polymerase subunit D n=1 Tax=unclassified Halorhabdus TaxID=2621901 RepID=UPI0012B25E56|nr:MULTISPECIES: DNA-directed RNA polymerase subunit D [unclassified Halorhabdus]QGN07118.1 DNA-directed RNA polymerase subunit D [Halorhabdus sp. CBA1104]
MAEYDVTFIEREEREARFLIRGVTPAFANGIRRAMIADVPTFSVDTVRVIENSSVMFDEQIGLRLGLVPLTTPLGDFEIGDEVTLALDVEGPGTAYSGDLVANDEMVEAADTDIPIIELKEDQRLELEADAVLETGRDHAKHQGGVAVSYRHLQRIEEGGERDEFADDESHIVRGVIEDDGDLIPTEDFDNDLTNRYPNTEVAVEDVPEAFVFHVETDGSFDVDTLVTEATDTLRSRAEALTDAVAL